MLTRIFDTETGAKVRAAFTALLAVASALIIFLQSALDVLGVLPDWEPVSVVSLWLAGAVAVLGRFTALGNKEQE